jgi:Tol biopolymer transport system component
LCIVLFIPAVLSAAAEKTITKSSPAGTFLHDSVPLIANFLPGIVSTDSLEFGSAFSPDGNSFYFTRSVRKETKIFVTTKTGAKWSAPVMLSISTPNYSDADPAFSPKGELYFISTRPVSPDDTTRDYNIWRTKPTATGHWTLPLPVDELNSLNDEFYISFTATGDACFSSSREGGYGNVDIYLSMYNKKRFTKPVNLGDKINSSFADYDPFISSDGNAIIFTSSGRKDSHGKADLYWAIKTKTGWTPAEHFSDAINTPGRDFCPFVFQNTRSLFFSSEGNVKSMPIKYLPENLRQVLSGPQSTNNKPQQD